MLCKLYHHETQKFKVSNLEVPFKDYLELKLSSSQVELITCGELKENGPHRLLHLTTQFPVGGTV